MNRITNNRPRTTLILSILMFTTTFPEEADLLWIIDWPGGRECQIFTSANQSTLWRPSSYVLEPKLNFCMTPWQMQNCRILGTYQWYHTMSFVMMSGLSWTSLPPIGILDLRFSIYLLLHQIELHHYAQRRHQVFVYLSVTHIAKSIELAKQRRN